MQQFRMLSVVALRLAFALTACGGPVGDPRDGGEEAEPAPQEPKTSSPVGEVSAREAVPVECDDKALPPRKVRDHDSSTLFALFETERYQMGFCVMEASVLEDGSVTDVRILRPTEVDPPLEEALVQLMESGRYEPPTQCGQPTSVQITLSVNHCPRPLDPNKGPG